MKMIKESFEIMDIPDPNDKLGVLMHLERIGRTCYKSEDKITQDSCHEFLKKIRDRKHWAMLEHYIFAIQVPEDIFHDFTSDIWTATEFAEVHDKLSFIRGTHWYSAGKDNPEYIISGSATAFNYIWEEISKIRFTYDPAFIELFRWMQFQYPELMRNPNSDDVPTESNIRTDISFIGREKMKTLPKNIRLLHDFTSTKYIVDRGVTHELVRHRPCSWAQESTRYCNYSAEKHDGEVCVILPSFFDTGMGEASNSLVFEEWKRSCLCAESAYMKLLEYKASPQQARTVLPQSTKAEIVMTARMIEKRHFFNMRADKPAHPQMKEVAVPELNYFVQNDPEMFEDLAWRVKENEEYV